MQEGMWNVRRPRSHELFPQQHHEIQGCRLPDRHSSSTSHHALLQQGKCFWEQAGDWIPAESSPSKIAIFKLNHFPNHTLKLLPFLASSLQLIGAQASMDLKDADFSEAAPIPFCRFLRPSICPSSLHCEPQPQITGATSLTLTERFTKSSSSSLQILVKRNDRSFQKLSWSLGELNDAERPGPG